MYARQLFAEIVQVPQSQLQTLPDYLQSKNHYLIRTGMNTQTRQSLTTLLEEIYLAKFFTMLSSDDRDDYQLIDCRNYFVVRIKSLNVLIGKEEPFQKEWYLHMYRALTSLLEGQETNFRCLLQ